MTPHPKPSRKSPTPRKPMKRSRLKPRNTKRRKSEFARIYGSRQRVEWVKAQPCIACGRRGYCDSAHIETGGMGKKAHYTKTVPLCGHLWSIVDNCHKEAHRGQETFATKYGIDLEEEAAKCERAWNLFQEERNGR